MTREKLVALGLTAEQADQAMALHTAILEGYVPKGNYDVLKAESENLKITNASMKAEVEKLKKFEGTNTELAAKIEKLQEDVTIKEENYKAELQKLRKSNAVELALLQGENKPYDLDLVKGLVDLSLIKLDGDKVISGLKEQVEALQTNKSFLFNPGEQKKEPFGFKPKDGNEKKPSGDDSGAFGKLLAKTKLTMMGISSEGGK